MEPEHAVLIYIRLSDDKFGAGDEREDMRDLEDRLEAAIQASDAGEFDGDEFGEGFCTLYLYGQDADTLYAAMESILKSSKLRKGSYAIKRYGSAKDPDSKEVRIEL